MTASPSSPGAVISAALLAIDVVIILGALVVLPGGRRPQTAMAWLILIIGVPLIGFALFLLFGRIAVGRRRRARQAEVNAAILAAAPLGELADAERTATLPAAVQGFVRLNRELGVLPITFGNDVELIDDYDASVAAMTRAVADAEHFVHVEFYIAAWDHVTAPFFEELVRAVDRGVTVRFLYDHLGSRGIPVYRDLLRRLSGTGVHAVAMLPIRPLRGQLRRPDLRNHRKIVVVDGRIAFSGSQNLIEPSYDKPRNRRRGRTWVELMARIEGPAARELDVVFATDWFTETGEALRQPAPEPHHAVGRPSDRPGAVRDVIHDVGVQVVPSGPGFTTENNLRLFTSMIYSARRSLVITSPYFVPDDSLLYALTTAAQRGVDVELFVGATADQFMVAHAQRSYYEALLRAGVRIWLYPGPNVLHAKHFSVDDEVAVVGSSNMDMRSFALNYEVEMMMTGRDLVSRLGEVQAAYRSVSTELTLASWQRRPRRRRYVENLMRLTATVQ